MVNYNKNLSQYQIEDDIFAYLCYTFFINRDDSMGGDSGEKGNY